MGVLDAIRSVIYPDGHPARESDNETQHEKDKANPPRIGVECSECNSHVRPEMLSVGAGVFFGAVCECSVAGMGRGARMGSFGTQLMIMHYVEEDREWKDGMPPSWPPASSNASYRSGGSE